MTEEDDVPDTPEQLLSNSGRISAILTLAEQAKDLSDRAQAIEDTTVNELSKNNSSLRRNNRFLRIALIVLVVLSLFQNYRATFISGPKLESVQDTVNGPLSDANTKLDNIVTFLDIIKPRLCHDLADAPPELIKYCKPKP